MTLTGRRALVTGGAQGIGRAIADALIDAGARVTVCDVRAEPGDITADVSNPDDVRRLVDESGPFDVLINNAGIVRRTHPTDDWEKAITDFDEIIGTNLRGAFLVGRAVIPGMVASGGGDIVNVATDHIHTCGWPTPVDHVHAAGCPYRDNPRPPGGGASMDLYDASKWGLTGLTQAWATALRGHGIRVNSLLRRRDRHADASFLPLPGTRPGHDRLMAPSGRGRRRRARPAASRPDRAERRCLARASSPAFVRGRVERPERLPPPGISPVQVN